METINYNLLHPSHFGCIELEPKPESFYIDNLEDHPLEADISFLHEEFNRAKKEWQSRNIKPEPEWIKFENQQPIDATSIWFRDTIKKEEYLAYYDIDLPDLWNGNLWMSKEDKSEYDKKLAHFNYFKKKYEGWELLSSNDHFKEYSFKKGNIYLHFSGELVTVIRIEYKVRFTCGIPNIRFTTFEHIYEDLTGEKP